MRIAFTGQPVLIAGIAAFVACLALAQSQTPTMHEGFVDVPGAKF
jgi:hypothetical protein